VIELLYGSGLRVSELVGLPLSALARDGRVLAVRGKGGKDRLAPVSEPARIALAAYLPCAADSRRRVGLRPICFPHAVRDRVS